MHRLPEGMVDGRARARWTITCEGLRVRQARRTYDHRIRHAVVDSGDPGLFSSLKIPRSTCRSWLRRGARHVVSTEPDALEQLVTIARLENRIRKLKAVVRLYAQLARSTRAQLTCHRLPDGDDKAQILRAIDAVEPVIGRRGVLRILGLKRRRLWVWRGRASRCQLDDAPPCPRTVPARLTTQERRAMQALVEDDRYRHLSLRSLALLGQRTGRVFASYQTWCRMVQKHGWRRPGRRLYPAKPRVGIRASVAGELLHVDVSVVRLLDGSRAYPHGIVDNFSRRESSLGSSNRICRRRRLDIFSRRPFDKVGSLGQIIRVMTDGGSENQVFDKDSEIGQAAQRVIAQVDVAESNSMIESLRNQLINRWLYTHTLDSFDTLERLTAESIYRTTTKSFRSQRCMVARQVKHSLVGKRTCPSD